MEKDIYVSLIKSEIERLEEKMKDAATFEEGCEIDSEIVECREVLNSL